MEKISRLSVINNFTTVQSMEPSRTSNGGYEGAKMKMCLDPNGEHHVTKRKITR